MSEEERRMGHKALRARNGKLEIFDPHPLLVEKKWEEKFEEWLKYKCINPHNIFAYSISDLKDAYLQGRRDEAKEGQEEIEKKFNPSIPLVYCKEHKTICMPFGGKLSCCLQSFLKKEKEENERLNRVYNLELGRVNKVENQHFEALLELQKEEEQTKYFRLEVNRLTDELAKEKERVKKLETVDTRHGVKLVDRLEKAEKRLEAERISVNELSLANQELTEKVRLTQEHADKLGGIISEQTEKRLELEERIKKLEDQLAKKLCGSILCYTEKVQTESRIKKLEATLASIKADESIGKIEVMDITTEDVFGEDD